MNSPKRANVHDKGKLSADVMRAVGPWIKDKMELWPMVLQNGASFEDGLRMGAILAIRDLLSEKLTVEGLSSVPRKGK